MPLNNKTGKRYQPKPLAIRYADIENAQVYGTIEKAMGNCHFTVNTLNGDTKTASLCGVLKKRGKVKSGDFVLIEPMSEDTDRKYQVIFKYTPQQKKILEKEGHLKIVSHNESNENTEDNMFAFEGDDEIEEDNTMNVNEDFIDDI